MASTASAIVPRFPSALTLLLILAACSGKPEEKKVEENVYPQNYRAEILDLLRKELPDPTGIRDTFLSDPALTNVGTTTRYVSCLRFDAKDGTGKYTGIREMAVYFYGGSITQMVKATPELCGKAPYQPFPELQKLCREVVCPRT